MRFLKWVLFVPILTLTTLAEALPLSTIGTFCSTFPDQCRKGTESLLAVRGIGTDAYYVLEVDPTTGAIPVSGTSSGTPIPVTQAGRAYADSVRYTYVTAAVGTTDWVQLIASTAAIFNAMTIFDSSGQTLELGVGAAASETRKLIVPPGGIDGQLSIAIPASSRVSIRALSGSAGTGEIDITGFQ